VDDIEALKTRVKKLNAQATQAKMDLHDLSEELPVSWERIPEVAARAHDAYRDLVAARAALAAASA
jgi:hypothetical protein